MSRIELYQTVSEQLNIFIFVKVKETPLSRFILLELVNSQNLLSFFKYFHLSKSKRDLDVKSGADYSLSDP